MLNAQLAKTTIALFSGLACACTTEAWTNADVQVSRIGPDAWHTSPVLLEDAGIASDLPTSDLKTDETDGPAPRDTSWGIDYIVGASDAVQRQDIGVPDTSDAQKDSGGPSTPDDSRPPGAQQDSRPPSVEDAAPVPECRSHGQCPQEQICAEGRCVDNACAYGENQCTVASSAARLVSRIGLTVEFPAGSFVAPQTIRVGQVASLPPAPDGLAFNSNAMSIEPYAARPGVAVELRFRFERPASRITLWRLDDAADPSWEPVTEFRVNGTLISFSTREFGIFRVFRPLADCQPSCDGKSCNSDDGCSNLCGTCCTSLAQCPANHACREGLCVPAPGISASCMRDADCSAGKCARGQQCTEGDCGVCIPLFPG